MRRARRRREREGEGPREKKCTDIKSGFPEIFKVVNSRKEDRQAGISLRRDTYVISNWVKVGRVFAKFLGRKYSRRLF
jgi:hypothetical protein